MNGLVQFLGGRLWNVCVCPLRVVGCVGESAFVVDDVWFRMFFCCVRLHLRLAAELCTFVTTATSQPVIPSTGSLVKRINPTCPMFAPTCTINDPNFPKLAPT